MAAVNESRRRIATYGGLGVAAVVALGLVGWAVGIAPRRLIGTAEPPRQQTHQPAPRDDMARFIAAVLGEAEDRWKELLEQAGQTYRAPRLVLYTRRTRSACGKAKAVTGPFYCPDDERVYLDTSFFREIETRFHGCEGKACQFAEAFVIAHEIGHHIQNLLGIMSKTSQLQAGLRGAAANRIQVQVELQADCFAGVWAHHQQKKREFLEPGDLDAVL